MVSPQIVFTYVILWLATNIEVYNESRPVIGP